MNGPEEYSVWDFWFAPKPESEPFHLHHLQAPKSLPDPHQRHFVAEIGHVVSDDLLNWRRIGTSGCSRFLDRPGDPDRVHDPP